jgi:DNA-binding NarL/FixJ family response regulator
MEFLEDNWQSFQCIIADISLEEGPEEGILCIAQIHARWPSLPIVIWTKHSDTFLLRAQKAADTRIGLRKYDQDGQLKEAVISAIRKETL